MSEFSLLAFLFCGTKNRQTHLNELQQGMMILHFTIGLLAGETYTHAECITLPHIMCMLDVVRSL